MDENSINLKQTVDYSEIDSIEKAIKLKEEGKLFKILLLPSEFGGQGEPRNAVYVPPGIPQAKDQITQTLIRFTREGLIDNLKVDLEYKGKSVVPSKIKMYTFHSEKTGKFNPVINVW